jgi:hypothetical protein
MTLEVTRLEPHVYLFESGVSMSMQEMTEALAKTARETQANSEEHFIIVVDLSQLQSLPFDVPGLRRLTSMHRTPIAVLLVRAPHIATMMANILDKVTDWHFEQFAAKEAAMQRASELLAQKQHLREN